MRFKNYITEGRELLDYISVEQMAEKFLKDCQPFFQDFYRIWRGDFFLSGRKSNKLFDKKKVRQNRRPVDTPEDIHHLIDNWFLRNFGIRARSNSIFGTFSYRVASDYGIPYYIIPIGKYVTLASSNIHDIFGDIIDTLISFEDEDDEEYIIKELDSAEYKINKRLQNNKTEYMISCKEYYMIEANFMTDNIKELVLTEMGLRP